MTSRETIRRALSERTFLTFGGNETYLLFIQGFPLREFCAFEVIDRHDAWERMKHELLSPIAEAAAANNLGLLTDCMVWRASSDYVNRLGPEGGVAEINKRAVKRTREFIDGWHASSPSSRNTPVILAGDLGPRGDGYKTTGRVSLEAAYDYHAPQIEALAAAGIELAVPMTMTSIAETLGILRALERTNLPALISPTIEPDGSLPDGTPLGEFFTAVDDATSGAAVGFMVNCAHPAHLEPTLERAAARDEPWLQRFRGLRANASAKTHAELDNSTELDRGEPQELAKRLAELKKTYNFSIVGGCCGTDAEHLRAIAQQV